ncbi:putative ribonuclease H-like domain-containing protein [Tanacetum coccineum]|uniref:Ribonuclease H-like domain-containing protein n=1 Tax=Tanacetum coccineum TaxID=301880 RepID=A0ABQ5CUT0_9ASTR
MKIRCTTSSRKNDVYIWIKRITIPSRGVTAFCKATKDEAVLWHRRLGHVNFKNINKLVQGNLVRGLPSKTFKLDHTCLACRKESVNRKKYCLVVTDDCSKFNWVFFLAYKDETYDMLHDLIVGLENKLRHKVKTIRTPSKMVLQNERKDSLEALKSMLADSLLPIQFWAEAVHTACYVLNRVLTFLRIRRIKKEKVLIGVLNLDLQTLQRITFCKEINYAASEGNVSTHDDVEDLDDQQFIVHGLNIHAAQPMHSEESTADKEVSFSSDEQALHDELVNLMHQESLAKLHHDAQRTAFEEEKKRIALAKGERMCTENSL